MICSNSSFCDGTEVTPPTVTPTGQPLIVDASPPPPVGFTFTDPTGASIGPPYLLILNPAQCPPGKTTTVLLYANLPYYSTPGCDDVYLQTGGANQQSGEYVYMNYTNTSYYRSVSELDAQAMIAMAGYRTSPYTTINKMSVTNYIRQNWYQTSGYPENPLNQTSSINVYCNHPNTLYYVLPVQYSSTPFNTLTNFPPSAYGNYYAYYYNARVQCT
jgi:hypothetical protein